MTTRVSLALLTILTTTLGTWMFCRVAARDGLGVVDFALAALFAVLLSWVAFSFWVATLGLIVQLRRGSHLQKTVAEPMDLPPTAVVMPIHNENPRNVFANIRAIAQSLQETGWCFPYPWRCCWAALILESHWRAKDC
jgi:membrane glycosyltransferase